ncbi:MAG: peptidylprolyl isomerase [Polyangiaceae bacterium]|nr:peptidylprolyl isomerase [Polyangiaceae bacterium]
MAFSYTLRAVVGLLAAAVVGCGSDEAPAASTASVPTTHGLTAEQAREVAATVGESQITVGEVAEALNDQSPYLRARYTSPERRSEFLDHLVQFELLAAEAERRGYRERPEVVDARKQALIAELVREEIDARVRPSDVTDAEISAYFAAHPDEFDQPEQVRASHILFRDRRRADRALAELKAKPSDIAHFRRIALESSEDPETRERGGDLRFFSRPPAEGANEPWHGPPMAVARAAFELTENGQIHAAVVESPAGFHVVARTAHRPAMRRTLDEVEGVIRHRLYRDRRDAAMQALLARLRNARIETNPEALTKVRLPEAPLPSGPAPEVQR